MILETGAMRNFLLETVARAMPGEPFSLHYSSAKRCKPSTIMQMIMRLFAMIQNRIRWKIAISRDGIKHRWFILALAKDPLALPSEVTGV